MRRRHDRRAEDFLAAMGLDEDDVRIFPRLPSPHRLWRRFWDWWLNSPQRLDR